MTLQNENANKLNASHAGTVNRSDFTFSEPHWTSTKYSKNMLIDALVKHLLGLVFYGQTDVGEVLEVAAQLKGDDEEIWINAWGAMAQRLQDRAEKADRANKKVTASTAYLRASTYWRASLMAFSKAGDLRIKENSLASTECYERYLELSDYPGEYIEIPYEDSFLPGHFYRSPVAEENAPLFIITPGHDTFAEDTCWVYDGAVRRGIHCLVFDGPGQGYALRLNNLTFRPDWENVITPVINFALSIPGIDPSRIGLMGLSFGGFLVPRAAAFEKRIKVLVVDPGNIAWGPLIASRLQPLSKLPRFLRPSFVESMVKDYAWKHGVSEKEVFQTLKRFDNTSVIDKITCETLVMDGTAEINPGTAQKFFDALQCPKDYMLFDETTTSQSHCQMGSYATATEYLFDWLDERL